MPHAVHSTPLGRFVGTTRASYLLCTMLRDLGVLLCDTHNARAQTSAIHEGFTGPTPGRPAISRLHPDLGPSTDVLTRDWTTSEHLVTTSDPGSHRGLSPSLVTTNTFES